MLNVLTDDVEILNQKAVAPQSLFAPILLGKPVIFRMRNRAAGPSRFSICRPDGSELTPSLDALLTGQLALFHLFATIIRYADNDDIIVCIPCSFFPESGV